MVKILKYFCTAFLILCSGGLSVFSQNRLDGFFGLIDGSCTSFKCTYSLVPSKNSAMSRVGAVTGSASVCIQGEAYVFDGDGLVIKSDGKEICVIDSNAKEAVFESVPEDLSEADFLQNPALLICGLKDNFRLKSSSADEFVLVPVVDCGIVECRLLFSANAQGPSSAFFKLSDGGVLEVKMTDYAFHPERSSDYFIQDQSSFDSDWIVTDLR